MLAGGLLGYGLGGGFGHGFGFGGGFGYGHGGFGHGGGYHNEQNTTTETTTENNTTINNYYGCATPTLYFICKLSGTNTVEERVERTFLECQNSPPRSGEVEKNSMVRETGRNQVRR